MHKFSGIIALFALVILLSACSLAADITPPPGSEQLPVQQVTRAVNDSPVFPIIPPDLVNGAAIYNNECAPCHGKTGQGDGPQAAQLSVPVATLGLSDFARHYTPAEWFDVVTHGDPDRFMPAFSDLTDRQRWDVVAYAMNLSVSDELVAQGEAIYQESCVSCHGVTGKADGPSVEGLSVKPQDLTDQSLMAKNSAVSLYQVISSGISPDMPAYAGLFTEEEHWALVAYIRSLAYTFHETVGEAYPAPSTAEPYPAPEVLPPPAVSQSPGVTSTFTISSSQPFLGTVVVQLINGSGGDAPSDATVTLYGFDNMQNTYSETLTTGDGGVYTFSDVAMPEGRVFLVSADYASGLYGSDIVTVDPADPDLDLQVTVYDSTTDPSALTTDRMHIFFDFTNPDKVQVIEVFIISNGSRQAVVAPTEDGTVLTFPLPEGYTNLQFQDGMLGDRFIEVPQGFADTLTVEPGVGDYQVIFAFEMPYDRKLDFSQPMFLPTDAVVVMVPENGVNVDSELLQDTGVRDFQGSTYRMFETNSLIAGSPLEFTLSGKPKQEGSALFSTGSTQNLAIGLGVFGLVLLGIGLWLYLRNQRKAAVQAASAGFNQASVSFAQDTESDDEDTLMDAIIALDDQYHAGNLPEEAYLERRAVLKEKLRGLNPG